MNSGGCDGSHLLKAFGFLVASCAVALIAAAPAAAEPGRVLLLSTAGDPTLSAERAAVERALSDALERQAFQVKRAPEPAAGETAQRCADAECAHALLESVGAELAVASAVWGPAQATNGQGTVTVQLIDRAGERYPAEEALGTAGTIAVEAAAEAALLDAQGLRMLGPGPWLEVSAEPAGALLVLDEVRVGALPYRAAIAPGTHSVALEQNGAVAWNSRVDVTLGTQQLARVHVVLDAGSGGARVTTDGASLVTEAEASPPAPAPGEPVTPQMRSEVSPWNYALGSVLAVAGVALLVVPLKTLVQQGDCVGDVDPVGRCSARVDAGAGTYVQLVAAGVLLAGSGVVFALRPLRVDVQVSSEHALARLSTTF